MGGTDRPEGDGGVIRTGKMLYGADLEVARWVASRVPDYTFSPDCRAIGIMHGDDLVAGVIYERCNGFNVEATIAAEPGARWADRTTLAALFDYPFRQLGVRAVTVLVAMTNLPSLNLATKLGFDPSAYVPFAAHDGSPLVILQQRKEQCRWISHEQEGWRQTPGDTGRLCDGNAEQRA